MIPSAAKQNIVLFHTCLLLSHVIFMLWHKNLYCCLLKGTGKLIWKKNNRQNILLGFFHSKDGGEILVLAQCRVTQGWKWMAKKAVDWRLLLPKCQFVSISYHSHISRVPMNLSIICLNCCFFQHLLSHSSEGGVWANEYQSWKNHKQATYKFCKLADEC